MQAGDNEQETVVKSTSDVRSLTYCDLHCISLTGLRQTLRMYPELAAQCATDLLNDLTYNLRDGYTDPDDDDDATVIPAVTLKIGDPAVTVNSRTTHTHRRVNTASK